MPKKRRPKLPLYQALKGLEQQLGLDGLAEVGIEPCLKAAAEHCPLCLCPSETVRNGSKRPETARNGPKRPETARNGPKRSKTVRYEFIR